MEALDDLLARCGFVKRDSFNADFPSFEHSVGFTLPMDYEYYLKKYYPFEGFIGDEYVVLYDLNTLLILNKNSSDGATRAMLIGSNGASENIGIQINDAENYQLVIAQYLSDVKDHIVIGASFTNMLERLINGVNWFK